MLDYKTLLRRKQETYLSLMKSFRDISHRMAKCGMECINLKDQLNTANKEIAHLKQAIVTQNKYTSNLMDEVENLKKM